jgi:hypothetical protein
MAEYKKEIATAVTIAVIAALGIGVFAVSTFHEGGLGAPSSQLTASTTISTTAQDPSNYALLAQAPQMLVTPKNHTFTIPFKVTTSNYSISLTYSPTDTYAWFYSNDTQWVFSGRPCESTTSRSVTGGSTIIRINSTASNTATSTTSSEPPCGVFPGEWLPVTGVRISQNSSISPNELQVSIQPSSAPAHYSGTMIMTLDIRLPPGKYGVFLALHVQEPDNPYFGTRLLYPISGYVPLVVSG